jgi:branched-chain amino acid transport system substrate-binding protein
MNRDRRRQGRRLLAATCASALLLGACASDSEGGGGGGSDTTQTPVDESVLGDPNAASGEAVKIGYVYDGTTDAIDNAGDLTAAEAATEYVNEYLAGIAGRPVELVVCSTDQTPAGAADCVTQFAQAEVSAVLNGVTGQAGSLFEPLSEAGIPVFVAAADPRDAGATIMTNGILSLAAGPAKAFADEGVTKATIIGIDVPAASAALKQSAPLFYGNVDVEVEVVLIPPDTPDMTPNIRAALASNPGGMTVVGDSLFCTKAMNAIDAAGYDGMLVVIPQCFDESFLENVNNLEGAIMLTTSSTDPNSEEYQLYRAVMTKYAGEDADLGATAPQSYQAVVGFVRAMAELEGDITPETVATALKEMPPTPMPLGDGITFQCNGEQVAISPQICSVEVLKTTLDADGQPGEFEVLDGAGLLDLG